MRGFTSTLKKAGFDLLDSNGLKAMWQPSEEELTQAVAYGKEIAGKW